MEFTVDDKAVFAATGGRPFDPAQPSLVFVHGAALDHTVWALQTRYFAHHGRNVLALDLPGHGRSAGPPLDAMADMADWVIRALDALAVESARLVGHSMGSLVALEAAARHPGRVTGLALLGTSVPMPVTDALLSAAEAGHHAAFDMVTLWGHSRDGQVRGQPGAGPVDDRQRPAPAGAFRRGRHVRRHDRLQRLRPRSGLGRQDPVPDTAAAGRPGRHDAAQAPPRRWPRQCPIARPSY